MIFDTVINVIRKAVGRKPYDAKIQIRQFGPLSWVRYRLVRNGLYWTGTEWSTQPLDALVYGSFQDAVRDWKVVRIK